MITKDGGIQSWFEYVLIIALLVAAFFLRLEHLLARVFHIDEYISMLAAQMTAQKGAPIFPSGLLYGHGILVSYVTAPFLRLLAFSEEIARWPSLLVGVVTVASFFVVGSRLFKSRPAGLFALTLAALDVSMILWSARHDPATATPAEFVDRATNDREGLLADLRDGLMESHLEGGAV